MKGYKVLDEGLINQYGYKYELNKKYYLHGELEWNKNGFHFCERPEDTLRYVGNKKNYVITNITAEGNIICGDDYGDNPYYGFTGLYASDIFTIDSILKREDFIKNVVESKIESRVIRLISLSDLNEDEIKYIKDKYKNELINSYIDYYQYDDKDAFSRRLIK